MPIYLILKKITMVWRMSAVMADRLWLIDSARPKTVNFADHGVGRKF